MTDAANLLSRIKPANAPRPIKMLIYGMPGVGKTVFAAGAPKPLFVDAEHGTRSLLNHPELKDIPVLPLSNFNEVDALFWQLKAGELPDRETIVIDSISELQKRNMDQLLDIASERDRNRNKFLPLQQDYHMNTEVLRRLVVSYRDLDRNLIVTAHVTESQDDSTGIMVVRPAVTPKLANTLEGIFDVVGYMTLEHTAQGPKRKLQIMPDRRVKAKTRVGGLPAVIENPTFAMFQEANARAAGQSETQDKEA